MTPAHARAAALATVDLDAWVQQAGGWPSVDWRAWDRARAQFVLTHRAGLAAAPERKA